MMNTTTVNATPATTTSIAMEKLWDMSFGRDQEIRDISSAALCSMEKEMHLHAIVFAKKLCKDIPAEDSHSVMGEPASEFAYAGAKAYCEAYVAAKGFTVTFDFESFEIRY